MEPSKPAVDHSLKDDRSLMSQGHCSSSGYGWVPFYKFVEPVFSGLVFLEGRCSSAIVDDTFDLITYASPGPDDTFDLFTYAFPGPALGEIVTTRYSSNKTKR